MFSDPQFWVAISFILFVLAIFKPVKNMLTTSLDAQINEIKNKISESENIKLEAQNTLSELKKRENEVQTEIDKLKDGSDEKIKLLRKSSETKLKEEINKRIQMSENKINQLVRDSNMLIKDHITENSIKLASEILIQNINDIKGKDLITKSIEELGQSIKK